MEREFLRSMDKLVIFNQETISTRTTPAPYGLVQYSLTLVFLRLVFQLSHPFSYDLVSLSFPRWLIVAFKFRFFVSLLPSFPPLSSFFRYCLEKNHPGISAKLGVLDFLPLPPRTYPRPFHKYKPSHSVYFPAGTRQPDFSPFVYQHDTHYILPRTYRMSPSSAHFPSSLFPGLQYHCPFSSPLNKQPSN